MEKETFMQRIFKTKPLEVIEAEEAGSKLERHMSLFDLICIGIGGTVGTGIFATAGEIISGTAGPAAMFSWFLSGLACCISGVAYMELTSRVPTTGSCYAYSYHALGELPAVIGAWLLTVEYGISAAGVATSWSGKVQEWILAESGKSIDWLNHDYYNLLAFSIQFACTILLLFGLRLGKKVVNCFTIAKVLLVLFMIIAGFSAFDASNYDPFLPARQETEAGSAFGIEGVVTGATQAFFGYVGFDEVVCLAADAKNPRETMPKAVFAVVMGTMMLSALSSAALAGMVPYTEAESFGAAFKAVGWSWAEYIVRLGEVATMPVVVLVAFLAQPRLNYALALDGQLPKIFGVVSKQGTIFWNTLITGIVMSLIAFFIPFDTLWDVVNVGVLTSFNFTNLSLVSIRIKEQSPKSALKLIWSYFFLAGGAMLALQKGYVDGGSTAWAIVAIVMAVIAVIVIVYVFFMCPQSLPLDRNYFKAPLVPFIPAIAIMFNWYLLVQTSNKGLYYSSLLFVLALIVYFGYGYHHSAARNDWKDTLNGDLRMEGKPSLVDVIPSSDWMYGDNRSSIGSFDGMQKHPK